MEFFDKKEEVIDVQLTRYGRHLLSRGKFKPVYYCFSDDEVIYDQRWVSGTITQEAQNSVEGRIQEETPRLKTQSSKANAEVTVFNHANNQAQNIIDLYNINTDQTQLMAIAAGAEPGAEEVAYQEILSSIKLDVDFADAEKLLEYRLGQKRYFSDYAPAWNVLFYKSPLSSSVPIYIKENIAQMTPQLDVVLTDICYKLKPHQEPFTTYRELKNILNKGEKYDKLAALNAGYTPDLEDEDSPADLNMAYELKEAYYNEYFSNFSVGDGNIFVEKDFLLVSFEEANVDFTKENFSLEVFEVLPGPSDKNTEQLNRLTFYDYSLRPSDLLGPDAVESVFDIQFDNNINAIVACSLINDERVLKTKNIYNTNVFACERYATPQEYESGNIYDLDPVDPEEVC
jgi:hypothetical protein